MKLDDAKEIIKNNPSSFLQEAPKRVNGKPTYICPICGNGSGSTGDGIAEDPKNPRYYKCFKCDEYGDVLHFIGKSRGLGFKDSIILGAKLNNITLDDTEPKSSITSETPSITNNLIDFSDFYEEANRNLGKTDYWLKRGINEAVANKYNLGYVENWKHPKQKSGNGKPVLIIPINEYCYLARDVRDNLTIEQERYSKQKVGGSALFNVEALKDERPLFVVEGEIDAISLLQLGYNAIGLGSTSNLKLFMKELEDSERERNAPIVIALDSDVTGTQVRRHLYDMVDKEGFIVLSKNICGKDEQYREYKDPNEALVHDKEQLIKNIEEAIEEVEEKKDKQIEEYRGYSAKAYIEKFLDDVNSQANIDEIKTGFEELDKLLEGGLYPGLYILGAISSLGKTTLLMQMADQIAQNGQDVLVVSLEMSRYELMAKSISRNTIIRAKSEGLSSKLAKTNLGISNGRRYKNYNEKEKELIKNAINDYSSYAGNLFILEGLGDIGVEQIKNEVAKHERITGKKPIVIIDYLQILAPYNERYTEKQNTDANVRELKRLSRDFKTPVIAISSFNRENYSKGVSMTAFKESGGIEYSSDVLIGLQLKGAGDKGADIKALMNREPRQVELHILKNRSGRANKYIDLEYYPKFNYFEQVIKTDFDYFVEQDSKKNS